MKRLLNGKLVEMTSAEVDEYQIARGYEKVEGEWVLVPVPIFVTAQEAKDAMTAWIDALTDKIQHQYPKVVQEGWFEEEAMARAFVESGATPEQLATLTADATAKGRTPEEHAGRIIANADQFRAIALQTRQLWLATSKAIDEATDPMQYEAILDAAKAQAAPLAQAYGLG